MNSRILFMGAPKLSIIMPSFNVANFISKAIDSVLNQSFKNWELLIIDDGSTDNIEDVVERYLHNDQRIHIYSKPNGGLSDARNFGLKIAKGEYIHFFDPDDYIDDVNWYESIFHEIFNSVISPDIIITGYKVEFRHEGREPHLISRELKLPFEGKFGEKCIQHVCYAWNKLFKLNFLKDNLLKYEVGLSRIEDAEFMSRVIQCKPKIIFIKNGGYVYVQQSSESLSKGFDKNIIYINKRRIGVDLQQIVYFNHINLINSHLINFLKLESLIATINRLYSVKPPISYKLKKRYLKSIEDLMPSSFYISGKLNFKTIFNYAIYWSMRRNLFRMVNSLQWLKAHS